MLTIWPSSFYVCKQRGGYSLLEASSVLADAYIDPCDPPNCTRLQKTVVSTHHREKLKYPEMKRVCF
jgi:hypothetical protein